ncbi:MAG: ArgE/DapE family deacylase [bacterium]|nr:ArgE/DapE family deacylase [bacterium]
MSGIKRSDPLLKAMRDRKNEVIELTQTLCGFATENPPGRFFEPCVDYLREVCESMGLTAQKIRVPAAYQKKYAPDYAQDEPRFNLIARWDVGAKRTLHFNSHYDVVPVSPNWKTNPFKPVVKGKRLYGRGTQDMKGCLAASLFAARAMLAEKIVPPWNIEYSFTCDEEIGGECGAGYIARKKLIKPDACIVCEGGWGDLISFGNRGVLWAEVCVRGQAGHGSNPAAGVNAFEQGMDLARRFQQLHKKHARRKTRAKMNNPEAQRPTMTLGGVSGGGSKINIIPDEFRFTIDRRLIAEEDVNQIMADYRAVLEEAKSQDAGLKAEIRFLTGYNAGLTDPAHPLCLTARDAAQKVNGGSAEIRMFGAFTDLHFFTNLIKCPTIGYGVVGDGLHSDEEYCLTDSLVNTARVYAEIALTLDAAWKG